MGSKNVVRLAATAFAGALLAAAAAGPAAAMRYRVRVGDTLSGIAAARGTTVGVLARLNHLNPNGILFAGSVIQIPGGRTPSSLVSYRVMPGDTLSGIAVRWGTSVSTIARLNHLDPAGILLAGRVLHLPRPASTPSVSSDWVRSCIVRWADHYGVDRALALSVAWMESGYQPGLTSADGAWGVMQVMPATWAYAEEVLIGQRIPRTTDGGIRVGVAFLHHLLHAFRGDQRLVLAGYYQGEAATRIYGVLPSSRFYVDGILAHTARL